MLDNFVDSVDFIDFVELAKRLLVLLDKEEKGYSIVHLLTQLLITCKG